MATEDRYAALPDPQRSPLPIGRMIPVAMVVGALAIIWAAGWQRDLSLETLARNRAAIDGFVAGHFSMAVAVFVALEVTVVGLSIPGALILTVAAGIVFGWWVAALAVVAGATIGATLIFLVARTACGSNAGCRRTGPRLSRIAGGLKADAFSYLLFLRLIPVFPFWLVNLAPAVLGVELRTFVAATAIGIIPGTVAFTLVGAGLDSVLGPQGAAYRHCLAVGGRDCHLGFDVHAILTPQVIAALAALGFLALIPILVRRWRARVPVNESPS